MNFDTCLGGQLSGFEVVSEQHCISVVCHCDCGAFSGI